MLTDGSEVFALRGHSEPLNVVRFLQRTLIASGDTDGQVRVWSLNSRRVVAELQLHEHEERTRGAMDLWYEGDALVTQGRDGLVKLWDVDLEAAVQAIQTRNFSFCKMCKVGMGRFAAPGDPPWDVNVFDWRQGEAPVDTIHTGKDLGMCTVALQVPNRPHLLALASEGGFVSVWDLRKASKTVTKKQIIKKSIISMVLRPGAEDGKLMGVSGGNGRSLCPFVIDLDAQKVQVMRKLVKKLEFPGVAEIRGHCAGGLFGMALWDHSARIYRWNDCSEAKVLRYHQDTVQTIDFMQDENQLVFATGSNDKRILVCRVTC